MNQDASEAAKDGSNARRDAAAPIGNAANASRWRLAAFALVWVGWQAFLIAMLSTK